MAITENQISLNIMKMIFRVNLCEYFPVWELHSEKTPRWF